MKQGRGRGLSYYHYCKMAGKTGEFDENQNQDYLDSKQECQPLNSNVRLYRKVKPGALGDRYC